MGKRGKGWQGRVGTAREDWGEMKPGGERPVLPVAVRCVVCLDYLQVGGLAKVHLVGVGGLLVGVHDGTCLRTLLEEAGAEGLPVERPEAAKLM